MSPQPQLAAVPPVDDRPLLEPISPELVLVDPVLAARARAALEPGPVRRRLGVASSSPVGLSTGESLRVARPPRPRLLPTLPNRPAEAATPPSSTASPAELPVAPRSAAAGAAVVAPEPAAPASRPSEREAATERPGTSITGLLLGIAVGLLGGIMAADAWLPREPAFEIATPRSTSDATPDAAGRGAVAVAPSVSGPKSGGSGVAPRKAAPPATTKKPPPTGPATRPATRKKAAPKQRAGGGSPAQARKRASVSAPAFVWVAVPGARRYEVVFERGGQVVYRATTRSTRLELPRSWRYGGKTHRLEPGRYRWTVWPIVAGNRGKPVVSADYTA